MDPKVTFFFYLAALVCFVLAAFAGAPGGGRRGRWRAVSLVPLGLALWLFPTFWDAATRAF